MPGTQTKLQMRLKCREVGTGVWRTPHRFAVYRLAHFLSARNMVVLGGLKFWGGLTFYKTFFLSKSIKTSKHTNKPLSGIFLKKYTWTIAKTRSGSLSLFPTSASLSARCLSMYHVEPWSYWAIRQVESKPRGDISWLNATEIICCDIYLRYH